MRIICFYIGQAGWRILLEVDLVLPTQGKNAKESLDASTALDVSDGAVGDRALASKLNPINGSSSRQGVLSENGFGWALWGEPYPCGAFSVRGTMMFEGSVGP